MPKKSPMNEELNKLFGSLEYHKFRDMKEILDKYDLPDNYQNNEDNNKSFIYEKFSLENKFPFIGQRAVLGFDLIGYSKQERDIQNTSPFLISLLLDLTYESLLNYEKNIFYMFTKRIIENGFIPAGDGGFQILPNPLYAIVFALHFEMNLRSLNAGRIYPKLSEFMGEQKFRYSLSFGDVFRFNRNFFGSALIRSSRILATDRLNRFLMDEMSYKYFLKEFNGIETLSLLNKEMLYKAKSFQKLRDNMYNNKESLVIRDVSEKLPGIDPIIIQDIGEIETKSEMYKVYNFFCQFSFDHYEENSIEPKKNYNQIRVSLGNLNPQGLV